jgi:hypothetical protein
VVVLPQWAELVVVLQEQKLEVTAALVVLHQFLARP